MTRVQEIKEEVLEALQNIYGCVQVQRHTDNSILLTDDNGEDIYKITITELY